MAGWATPSHCLVLPARAPTGQSEVGLLPATRPLIQSEVGILHVRSVSQSDGGVGLCQYGGQQHQQLGHGRKSSPDEKENEDSSAVVSSTQDVEKLPGRYQQMSGDGARHYSEEGHRKQDHFGSIISMLNEIQDATNCDIEQILAEGNFQQEIKTENSMELEMGGNELNYMANQDLYPTSYLRQQTCTGSEEVYRYSPVTSPGAESESPASSLQYSAHLHHSPSSHNLKDYSSPSPQLKGPYSPSSPGSGSKERSKDEKYWERRRKNNLAAKKSRDARRVRENQLRLRVLCLENANRVLRTQLDRSHDDNLLLRDRLKKYEGESCLPYAPEKPAEYSMAAGEADYDGRVGEADYSSLRGGGVAGNSNYRHHHHHQEKQQQQHCDSGGGGERQLTALA